MDTVGDVIARGWCRCAGVRVCGRVWDWEWERAAAAAVVGRHRHRQAQAQARIRYWVGGIGRPPGPGQQQVASEPAPVSQVCQDSQGGR